MKTALKVVLAVLAAVALAALGLASPLHAASVAACWDSDEQE
jgi:hypothetical protein